ncbi:TetR/AcrR family transcriptional regulator [Aldersonia kunmingensis]|uniref:TetR/AcrR family transcriptional regulator n=1 Tax=Aldersonia kunmingensis TaxID=408066 RepID=UPI000AAAF04B|nr:TetR/AcrR family transcriptional regulator [Aldersonia kunmingensis]
MDLSERQRIRRSELLHAGIELLGAPDGPAVAVRAVCRRCGLTERYFYESFADREVFVAEVYKYVADEARNVLIAAVASADNPPDRAQAAVEAFAQLIIDRPAMGRVLLIAPMTEPSLGGRSLQSAPAFAVLIGEQLDTVSDPEDRQLLSVGLVGALASLFIAYLDGIITVDRDRFVEHCVDLLANAYSWQRGQK